MNLIERYESAAQQFIRSAPVLFQRATAAEILDEDGKRYIDFYSGGGTLTYGHNDVRVCSALIDYLCHDRIVQTRERGSPAKREFISAFVKTILEPRQLDYKVAFTDPASGTSAEFALRLARRVTQRTRVIAFTNALHGFTEGASTVTAKHANKFEPLDLRSNTTFMPYCGYLGPDVDTLPYLQRYLEDPGSGIERPAAVIVSPVQDAGAVNVATAPWLKRLSELCRGFDILLIVDETRTGCGRTGPFFSFETAGIIPDMVLVPHAIAGGLPISMALIRPDLDHWRPGEQSGIFHGDNLSFVAATELLAHWRGSALSERAAAGAALFRERLSALPHAFVPGAISVQGIGMLWSLAFSRSGAATVVSSWALEKGLIVEAAPLSDSVLLVMPPLTADRGILLEGIDALSSAVSMFLRNERRV